MQGNNVYPIDIFSVFKYGVEKWQKWFFWPFHHDWFLGLQKDIKNIFTVFINENDNEIGDIALIKLQLYFELSNILYAVKVVQELKKSGKKISYSDNSVYFKGLVEKGVPEISFIEKSESRKANLLRQILGAISKLRDIILSRSYFFSCKDKIPLIVITKYVLKRRYISHLGRKVLRIYNIDRVFRDKKIALLPPLFENIRSTANHFTQEIHSIADRYSIILTREQIEFIRNLVFQQFKKTGEDYAAVKHKLRSIKKFQK